MDVSIPPRTGKKNFHHGTERIQSEVNEEKGPGGSERERTKSQQKKVFLIVAVCCLKSFEKKNAAETRNQATKKSCESFTRIDTNRRYRINKVFFSSSSLYYSVVFVRKNKQTEKTNNSIWIVFNKTSIKLMNYEWRKLRWG